MTSSTRLIWLGLAALPYLALAGVDAWMHERARKVPALERAIHYVSAVALIGFIAGALRGQRSLAVSSLAVFVALLAFDEVGFHARIARSERRLHFAAYGALAFLIVVWQWTVRHA
jgi:hypothetical protein